MHGYQHTLLNTACSLPLCGALVLADHPVTAACLGVGLAFGTLLVTPDLDLHRNDARRRWGSLRGIWFLYAHFSRHRGVSHSYVVGPVTRLLYLAAWMFLPVLLVARLSPGLAAQTAAWLSLHWNGVVLAVLGYLIAQWLHLMADGIWPLAGLVKTRP